MSKGGKKHIRVTGVPPGVTVDSLKKIIAEAKAAGMSAKHIRNLEGQLKVLQRNVKFRGVASARMIVAKAGTILLIAEVTSIVNHGCDRIELRKIGEDTDAAGNVTATYFGKKFEQTGFLGFGPEKQTGSLIYVLTVPKERIDRDGPPREELNPRVYNVDAYSDLLEQMGISEEWILLPDGINSQEDLLNMQSDEEQSLNQPDSASAVPKKKLPAFIRYADGTMINTATCEVTLGPGPKI